MYVKVLRVNKTTGKQRNCASLIFDCKFRDKYTNLVKAIYFMFCLDIFARRVNIRGSSEVTLLVF